jgi:FG-GAP-like repeat/Abnormal spindle-like microcephaly-assoc'd, ASPM-SPD-2-Hydin
MKSLRFLGLIAILCSISAMAQSNPVPLISQPLIPITVKPGHVGFTLTVNGFGFASTAVVNWNGSPRTTQFFSSSQLKATVDASDVAQPGTASVTVTNPAPGGGSSNIVLFPVQMRTPTVAMFPIASFPPTSANAVGDFNGDGISDIAVGIDGEPGEIDVYPGRGDGTFGKPIRTKTLVAVYSLLAADFNRDGKLDLAAVDGLGTVTVYLGDGKGGFSQQQVFNEEHAAALQTADFNGDGKLDLAIANGQIIDIRLGNGDGTFGAPQPITFNALVGNPAIGDFNQDGILDLAVPAASYVFVCLGNGDGTFQTPVLYDAPFSGYSAAAADVNGDGKLDIVNNGLSVLLGNGDGTFTPDGGVQLQISGSFANVNLADFNGDGKLDAAVVVYDGSTQMFSVDLLLGNGDGSFQTPLTLSPPATTPIVNLSMGDFNQDGKIDLVGGALLLQISVTLSPNSLGFGDQTIGTKSSPQDATLTNMGSSQLDITNIDITGDPKEFAQTNNCGSKLKAGGSCRIKVTFAPKSVGTKQATLNVSYQGLGSPQTVSLTGTGVNAATVSLKPSSLTFSTQLVHTSSSPQAATLTNTGSVDVTISNISTTGSFSQTNNCPSDLPVGANCKIEVTFTPTGKGRASGKLSVTDNAKGSPQTVALSGIGTVVKFSPSGVNFGDQKVGTKSSPVAIELTNTGTTSLSISGIAINGMDPGDFSQTNDCGTKVAAGGHCTIKVRFTPKAKGQRSATLAVSDDGGGSPQTVPLAGTGT